MDHNDDDKTIYDFYDDESNFYDDDSIGISHIEDESITESMKELMQKEIATTKVVVRDDQKYQREEMMTTDAVAKLLQQLNLKEQSKSLVLNEDNNFSAPIMVRNINSAKPSSSVEKKDGVTHPQKTLEQILHLNGYEQELISLQSVTKDFFLQMTDENVKAYTNEMLKAVRTEDIKTMNTFLNDGKNLQCCNSFGESIISLACRNRSVRVVNFLLKKANISIQICDDYGRTPLHDACWVNDPNFKLIEMLLDECPDLFVICDKRGHSPLSYAQKEYHANWNSFLWENKDKIRPSLLGTKIAPDES